VRDDGRQGARSKGAGGVGYGRERVGEARGYQRVSRHMVDLVYRLDATPATRAALVPVSSAHDRR
jgi:hypothetical protein